MRALISNSLIPKLKPEAKQYDIRDTKLKGFLIRVNPSGKMAYVCEYKRGRRMNLGNVTVLSPAQARDKAKILLAEVAQGNDPAELANRKPGLCLREFIEKEYAPWAVAHRKSGASAVAHIKRCFFKPFGSKPLAEITPIVIDQWRTQRLKDGRTIETANRDVATFKAALSKAVLWGYIDQHPLAKLKLLKTDSNGNIRFLSSEEEQRLRQALKMRDAQIKQERMSANQWRQERGYGLLTELNGHAFADHLHPMVLLSLNTGLRQGEVFSLRWLNVNLERAMLTIEGLYAKSNKTLHLPLNQEAWHVLQKWREQTASLDYVFPNKDGQPFDNVKKSWANLLNAAAIKDFRWHDMRHHFASKLVMAGVDLNTVRELLGHSDIKMTLRYAYLAPEHKAKAVARLVQEEVML
jgi:integrase